jgi:hypothetical protein
VKTHEDSAVVLVTAEVTYRRCAKGFRRSGAVLVDRRVAKISDSVRQSIAQASGIERAGDGKALWTGEERRA